MSDREELPASRQAPNNPDSHAAQQPLDQMPVADLFAIALQGDRDDESSWIPILELRRRGTAEVFDAALTHVNSHDPNSRVRGLDVLARLGAGKPDAERPHLRESISIATRHLADPESIVVQAAAWASAHLEAAQGSQALLSIRRHPDPDVRHAVAFGLGGVNRRDSIEALIELSKDVNDDVRNLASFGLGTLCDEDSPEIRAALVECLSDPVEDVRDEALWGLALRKDKVSLRLLLERIEEGNWTLGDEHAARGATGSAPSASIVEVCAVLRRLLE